MIVNPGIMIHKLFPVAIYENVFPNIDNTKLETLILEWGKELRPSSNLYLDKIVKNYKDIHGIGEVQYTVNGKTSFFDRNLNQLHKKEEFADLLWAINESTFQYFKEVGHDVDLLPFLKIGKMWFNINRVGSYHGKHIHRNSYLSGVYYIKASDKSAPICFDDPKLPLRMFEVDSNPDSPYMIEYKEFFPESGKLLLFPSYLQHEVKQQIHENDERISISFNIDFDYRELSKFEEQHEQDNV